MVPPLSTEELLLVNCTKSGFQSNVPKNSAEDMAIMKHNSGGWSEGSIGIMDLKKNILTFRDIIDLPSYNSSLIHLTIRTIVDLHKLYPNVIRFNLSSETNDDSVTQGLVHLYTALKSVGTLWGLTNCEDKTEESLQNIGLEQLVGMLLAKLTCMINMAKGMFGETDEYDNNENEIESCKVACPSPYASALIPPEPALTAKPEFLNASSFQPTGDLKPDDIKCFTFNVFPHLSAQNFSPVKETNEATDRLIAENNAGEKEPMRVSFEGPKDSNGKNDVATIPNLESNAVNEARDSAAAIPPPAPRTPPRVPPTISPTVTSLPSVQLLKVTTTPLPPPTPPSIGSAALAAPPMALTKTAAPPPPPPLNLPNALRLKRAATKLKRSTQMGNLYRLLKGKVEGSSLTGGSSRWRETNTEGGPRMKEGMADAITEMTKRSKYFQQIEEDVLKHAQLILEVKAAVNSIKTKDMDELIKFHTYVEQNLEMLTDETQVLQRFEGFPMKKLESLRVAKALYLKLKGILTDLKNWKIMPPLEQLLDRVESYFNKIKVELDALERSKDDDSKQFEKNNIHFDFGILVQIKESLVDVSSSCMELALKEEREATEITIAESGPKNESPRKAYIKLLWRAFQLAFRVYSFAGGQDDRADRLSMEVAHEIETDVQ